MLFLHVFVQWFVCSPHWIAIALYLLCVVTGIDLHWFGLAWACFSTLFVLCYRSQRALNCLVSLRTTPWMIGSVVAKLKARSWPLDRPRAWTRECWPVRANLMVITCILSDRLRHGCLQLCMHASVLYFATNWFEIKQCTVVDFSNRYLTNSENSHYCIDSVLIHCR